MDHAVWNVSLCIKQLHLENKVKQQTITHLSTWQETTHLQKDCLDSHQIRSRRIKRQKPALQNKSWRQPQRFAFFHENLSQFDFHALLNKLTAWLQKWAINSSQPRLFRDVCCWVTLLFGSSQCLEKRNIKFISHSHQCAKLHHKKRFIWVFPKVLLFVSWGWESVMSDRVKFQCVHVFEGHTDKDR